MRRRIRGFSWKTCCARMPSACTFQGGYRVFGILDFAVPILHDYIVVHFDPLLEKRHIMRAHLPATDYMNVGPDRYRYQFRRLDLRTLGNLHANLVRSSGLRGYPDHERQSGAL